MLVVLFATPANGHGLPIDISIDSATQQVVVSQGFDSGVFFNSPILGLSTDTPGLGVLGESNGIAPNDRIGLRVTQELLYWDGSALAPTSATLTVNNADLNLIESSVVTGSSGLQDAITWATYPESAGSFWDADGLFQLSAGSPQGTYGLVVQVSVDRAAPGDDPIPSRPFVIPFLHNGSFLPEVDAILAFRDAVVQPDGADFNRDWQVDELDLEILQQGFSLSPAADVQGDADADLDVDGADFLVFQRSLTTPDSAQLVAVQTVPEPSTAILACFAAVAFATRRKAYSCLNN